MSHPKVPATPLGRRLRAAREAFGWSQLELARRLGLPDPVSGSTRVSRYESGQHRPDPATMEALAKILGLPVAYFYASSDLLSEIILLASQLPVTKQKQVLEHLRQMSGKTRE